MKRFFPATRLVVVISLLLNAIWLSPAGAVTAPQIVWLSELSGVSLVSPRAIDVDGQGNLYVADQVARAVLKYDRYGRYVASFLEGQVSGKGVAVTPDGQTLYVSTKAKAVAIVNAADGSVSGYLSGAELGNPAEIDLDAEGYVFVADTGAGQFNVKIFFPNGTFKSMFGGAGKTAGLFTNVVALTVNPHAARVYVANGEAAVPRLQVFDTAGALQSSVLNATLYGSDNHTGRGVAFEGQADGRAYVLRYLQPALRVFDDSFATLLGDFGSLSGKLTAPVDAVYDPVTKRLFVSDGSGVDIFGVDGGTTPVNMNSAPTPPVATSPVGGTMVASSSPLLVWNKSTDANGDALTYQVTVTQGAVTVFSTTTDAVSVTVPAGLLAENGSYAWVVQASDGDATSGPSATALFTVNATDEAPSAPTAVAPLAGENLGDAGLLSWAASTDPDPNDALLTYQLEISAENTFASPLLTETFPATSVALADLAGYNDLSVGTGYFWRVTALDADGTASVPSAIGRFVYNVMQLSVTANVSDARVYLSGNHGFAGQFVGVAPLELRNPAAGQFSVVVERPGFDPYVAQVTLTEGANATVSAVLLPARKQTEFSAGTINNKNGIAVAANAAPFLVDFNDDGLLDLLVGDAGGVVSIFPAVVNQSAINLVVQHKVGLGLPVLPGAVPFVADWNNDGRKDLLVGVAGGTVELFLNAGTDNAPVFGASQALKVGGSVLSVGSGASPAVVDLDGDGAKDLVVANAAGKVSVYYNQATDAAPQLADGAVLFQAAGAAQITPVDWDADGDRDLLVTVGGAPVFYRNDLAAANAFVAAGTLPLTGVFGLAAVEVNGLAGKDLLIGQVDGKLLFKPSTSKVYADTLITYLLAEWEKLTLLVATENPAALPQADKANAQLVAGKYAAAKKSALVLADMLAAGSEARTAIESMIALLK
ncbi:MAG: FG-GAP-like repeat-containing protein [Desulfuromonadales bacterium]|nr:FG-GAP-like repeat-containing protein [Desulfuromonadales bacterium]